MIISTPEDEQKLKEIRMQYQDALNSAARDYRDKIRAIEDAYQDALMRWRKDKAQLAAWRQERG